LTHHRAPARPLRVVFAGTPEFSLPCLDALIASGHPVVGVYTQPDRPSGRGRGVSQSPVKQHALALDLPVFQPESLRDPVARRALEALRPDLIIVVAYGLILTGAVLAVPGIGCWNVHGSILPRWRGAAPIQRALLAGDAETGVDLMLMHKGLDTGPVLLSRRTAILPSDTGGSLHDRLALLGADVLGEGLRRVDDGSLPAPRPQPEHGVEYAHKIEKSEAMLDFNESCLAVERKVRAFSPWPIAETRLFGERLRIHSATAVIAAHGQNPGSVLGADRDGIDVACADGVLRITRLQRDNARPVAASDFLNARPELRQR